MLQAPSHLSRVCGHSHIKKFWLMQTQNESQACENKSGLLASSSLPVPSSSAKGPDSKQSPQRSSGSPGMRSLLAGASSSGLSVRPLLGGAMIPAGYGGVSAASRHTSLVTCAESLSSPVRLDQTYRSFRSPSPDFSAIKFIEENEQRDSEVNCGVLKTPIGEGGFSPLSSQYGSPSEDAEVDLVDNASREAELTNAFNMGLPSVKAEATDATNVQLPTGSTVPSVCDSLTSPRKEDLSTEDREHICCNISTSVEGADFCKDLDTSHTESQSLENESSDSGTDDGNFEYFRSPVRGARTIYSDKRARPLAGKALCSGWVSSIPPVLRNDSGKGSRTGELHSGNLPSGNREASPEDANGVRNSVLRICSLCGTSKTPLWRSGPHGPKSLCNACGIRFKKSKRCPVQIEGNDHLASPLASPDVSKPPSRPLKRKQDTFLACEVSCPRDPGSEVALSEAAFQHQKRSRWPKLMVKREIGGHMAEFTGSSGESCLTLNLHSPSSGSLSPRKLDLNARAQSEFIKLATVEEHRTAGRVIAKDEEEAAVLLMYLSCGLVYA